MKSGNQFIAASQLPSKKRYIVYLSLYKRETRFLNDLKQGFWMQIAFPRKFKKKRRK